MSLANLYQIKYFQLDSLFWFRLEWNWMGDLKFKSYLVHFYFHCSHDFSLINNRIWGVLFTFMVRIFLCTCLLINYKFNSCLSTMLEKLGTLNKVKPWKERKYVRMAPLYIIKCVKAHYNFYSVLVRCTMQWG